MVWHSLVVDVIMAWNVTVGLFNLIIVARWCGSKWHSEEGTA